MKDSLKKPYVLVLVATFFLTLAAVIFRSVLLFKFYEPDVGHFASTLASDLFFPLLLLICAAFFILFGILSRKEYDKHTLPPSIPVIFASAFSTVAVLVWVITRMARVFGDGSSPSLLQRVFGVLMLLFALTLAGYFILCAVGSVTDNLRAAGSIGSVLFFVFYILFHYFDTTMALNNPIKIFDQLTFICLAGFMLMECRFHLQKAHYAVYLPISFLSLLFTATSAIPSLLYNLKSHTATAADIMHDFMLFAFFIYIAARLLSLLNDKEQEEPLGAYAQEIAEEKEKSFTPDLETHVASESDPAQQSFDFDGTTTVEEVDATDRTEEPSGEYETDAQTTIDFETTND